jgi:23S rRNA (adenine2503-C2)-methyltransferase
VTFRWNLMSDEPMIRSLPTEERVSLLPLLVEASDDPEAAEILRNAGLDSFQIQGVRNRLFKQFLSDEAVIRGLPVLQRFSLHGLELCVRSDSSVDGATKLLFRTPSGMLTETVILRIASGRTSLCVSTQVGCAAGCLFCATGRMGFLQNLSSIEILDQVVQAGQILATERRRLRNIVFMGMGEPFHNEDNLYLALESLTHGRRFNRAPESILVSTVGIPEAMVRCARRFPTVNLALSLHSADSDIRASIIPLARKYPLEEMRNAIESVNQIQRVPVMIEYLMLRRMNDSIDQARRLAEWLHGLNVHVNLIPYNPIEDAPQIEGSSSDVIAEFSQCLRNYGFKVTVRYSLGQDINAACGQLVRNEIRRRQP